MSSRRSIALLLLLALMAVVARTAVAGELQVFPREVVVSLDYPAHLVVLETEAGESTDVTHSTDLQLSVSGSDAFRVEAGGVLRLTREASDGGTGQLHVRKGDQHCSVPVRVAVGRHLAPIFPREVSAVLGKTGCNLGTCHGNLHGKAGFRLSLRGDDPALDYAAIVRGQGGRRIDRFESMQSLLLKKPIGAVAHQGGVRFQSDSLKPASCPNGSPKARTGTGMPMLLCRQRTKPRGQRKCSSRSASIRRT